MQRESDEKESIEMGIRTPEYISGLRDFVRQLKDYRALTLVEIGSFEGESTGVFHESGLFKEIFCVDPYKSCNDFDERTIKNALRVFSDKFKYAYNIVQVRGTIDDFVSKHINGPKRIEVDGVYIDGSHKHEDVMHDIQVTKDIIKPKVFIAGHDYGDFNCPDVVPAVNESFGRSPDMTFIDTSWVYWQSLDDQQIRRLS